MSKSDECGKPWVFLGLGNVLFNEDPAFANLYVLIYQVLQQKDDSLTFDKLLDERDELIKEGDLHPLLTMTKESLSREEDSAVRKEFRKRLEDNWVKYNPLLDGVQEVLANLSKKYNIGLLANAPAFIRGVLQEKEIIKYFKVLILSEEIGLPKPDIGLFKRALIEAEDYCENKQEKFNAGQCIMVGDSLDQDIRPAKETGMITVQLLWDFDKKYKNYNMKDDKSFDSYLEHMKRHSSRRRAAAKENEKPHFIVDSLEQLQELLLSDKIGVVSKS